MRVYTASKNYKIPSIDLLSLLFDSPACGSNEDTVIHADAADPSNSITKSQARTLTKRTAYGLRHRYGIGASGPGKDIVVCISSGQPLLPILFFGVIAAGGVYSAASSSFTAPELARQIKQGESNLIFCSADTKDVATQAATECGVPLSRVLVLESGSRPWRMRAIVGAEEVLGEGEMEWERITDPKVLDETLILLLYSSGTTGVPKGVLLSHQNIVAEAVIPAEIAREYLAEREAAGDPPFEYRTLAHLPTAHIAGVQGYFINPFYTGGPVYWMPKFDFSKFLEYNKRHKITFFFTVPPIYLLIAKSPLVTDQFDSLQVAISGAAPLGKELQIAASAKLGKGEAFISQTWGLSETTGSVTYMPRGQKDDTGSVSPLLPNMSIRLVDDDDKDVEPGQPGEVLVKGPVVTKGYHNNPQATREAFTADGWFRTGDILEVRNGMFYIVDRKKELIKYKGLQVAPAELEALLTSHPKIMDAAVIGVPGSGKDEGTEVPRAYVVPTGGIGKEEVMEWVKGKAARYKQLRGGVVFLDKIPKSPSGKILRKDLRVLAGKEGSVKSKL